MKSAAEQDASNPPKYQAIAAELAQNILDGQLSAGEKLPPHRVLALRLGVTTATVSRAYATLESQGLATARVGDGTYVRTISRTADDSVVVATDGPIDLAHNVAIPTDEVEALRQVFSDLSQDPARMASMLGYQPETGAKHHRKVGAQWLRRFGTTGAWNRVMVTHGAQHALAGVLRTLARPGDTLLTENLSYPGLLALARSLRVAGRLEPVFVEDITQMPGAILAMARDGDVVLTMGAGTIGAVAAQVRELASRQGGADVPA